MMDFSNKAVLITGGSSGIGAAAAEAFSAAGARVALVGRDQTKLAAVAARCASPLVLRADIAHDAEAARVVHDTVHELGRLDVLVNNAGMTTPNGGLLAGDMMTAYDAVMSTNLRAAVLLTHLAAPHLIDTGGNVVNISSIAGTMPPIEPGLISYYVSKAGMNHFTVCAASELGAHGVRVNAISPGPARTDFMDNAKSSIKWDDLVDKTILERVSEPEEIADLILFLASDKAKSITGSNYVIDNGVLVKKI